MYRVYENLKNDLLADASSMGRVLARPLATAILHDDVWRAYEIINSPTRATGEGRGSQPQVMMVLDARQKVYVSTQPKQYPMLSDLAADDPAAGPLRQAIDAMVAPEFTVITLPSTDRFYILTPIMSDEVRLATLVMGYSRSMFVPRFFDMASSAVVMTLLALALLLPVTWYWAWRMAIPLTRLAEAMGRVGPTLPDLADCRLYVSRDEIGQVGTAFARMLGQLKEKEALEAQMLHSERLAAVGRLAAGIAHEINNPLGGMLNAISTFKKHGNDDPQTMKTLSLIERGLVQIKDIIAALLVEARLQSHPLSVQDIEDTCTLVLSDAHRKSAELVWENDIMDALPLPSTLVRQILINLLLNAIAAVETQGRVRCHIYRDSTNMIMRVENGGQHIPPERMNYLFEPFSSSREGGTGLGLWVIYQITQQMKGEIAVQSQPGLTCFVVTLPIVEASP
ncbi:MAG: HAMP domain-containing histidine kinase [Bradyrhizobium sp.]|nr:HAMP domain-containing histidine kinase [Bradyrhizobium sp.]